MKTFAKNDDDFNLSSFFLIFFFDWKIINWLKVSRKLYWFEKKRKKNFFSHFLFYHKREKRETSCVKQERKIAENWEKWAKMFVLQKRALSHLKTNGEAPKSRRRWDSDCEMRKWQGFWDFARNICEDWWDFEKNRLSKFKKLKFLSWELVLKIFNFKKRKLLKLTRKCRKNGKTKTKFF